MIQIITVRKLRSWKNFKPERKIPKKLNNNIMNPVHIIIITTLHIIHMFS